MSIQYQILGKPGKDNALMVWMNAGTKMYRLLFDCGENIFADLKPSEITSIDYIFFSHFHLDHASGFDYFFRRNYDRVSKPIYIFGPEGTTKFIQHHMLGFKWNLINNIPGEWIISDISDNQLVTSKFYTSEGFSKRHKINKKKFDGILINNNHFKVKVSLLNHIIPSAAFIVTEKDWSNIDKEELTSFGLTAGPWLEKLKNPSTDETKIIQIDGKSFNLKKLKKLLLKKHEGDSIAYLTDFLYDQFSKTRVKKLIKNCKTLVCESQYSSSDAALAKKNYHLTSLQSARIAKSSNASKLILFHISERYNFDKRYHRLLEEARTIFPNTFLPLNWP